MDQKWTWTGSGPELDNYLQLKDYHPDFLKRRLLLQNKETLKPIPVPPYLAIFPIFCQDFVDFANFSTSVDKP